MAKNKQDKADEIESLHVMKSNYDAIFISKPIIIDNRDKVEDLKINIDLIE